MVTKWQYELNKSGEQKTPEWVQCENYFGGYDYENV